jgi:hypothetical protein
MAAMGLDRSPVPVAGFALWVGLAAGYRAAVGIDAIQGVWNVVALAIGFGLASAANWIVAIRFVEPVLDKEDEGLPRSTLFFIPVRYCTFLTAAIGLVFLVPNVIDILTSS